MILNPPLSLSPIPPLFLFSILFSILFSCLLAPPSPLPRQVREFDYSKDPTVKEFTLASFNDSGECVVLGNFDKFFMFTHNGQSDTFEEHPPKVRKKGRGEEDEERKRRRR